MKHYQTYLFDFDYTLVDSSNGIVICFQHVLKRHGYHQIDDYAIKQTIGKTLQESFSLLTSITDADMLEQLRQEYEKEADTYMTVNTWLFPEVERTLHTLKSNGAKIGIISTKYRYRILELVEKAFPKDFFDIILGGEDVLENKPSPEGLNHAVKSLQVDKNSTLYIGDSTVDAETARNAGVDFAGVLHGLTTREELAAYPYVCIIPALDGLIM